MRQRIDVSVSDGNGQLTQVEVSCQKINFLFSLVIAWKRKKIILLIREEEGHALIEMRL